MGKQNRQRRAAKRRRRSAEQRRRAANRRTGNGPGTRGAPERSAGAHETGGSRRPSGGPHDHPPSDEALIRAAIWSWEHEPDAHDVLVDRIAERGPSAAAVVDRQVRATIPPLWEGGWTPADVVHVASRRLSSAHADALARFVVADGRRTIERGVPMHPRWHTQLVLLEDRAARASGDPGLRVALALLCLLVRLPVVTTTMPAPGASTHEPDTYGALDERMLARVRALLAKAESTEFEDEADAFTAKAQELITRHAIAEAALRSVDDVGEPSVRRVPLPDPYADAKASLITEIAEANRCEAVQTPSFGWVTVFGYDDDLDAVEVLGASLLTQATSAMARQGPRRDVTGRSTTRSFRRAFLLGFAHRVGERLRAAAAGQMAEATDADRQRALPVLAARDDRLHAARDAAFPDLVMRSRSTRNASGFAAGRAAADAADLHPSSGALRDSS